MPPTLGRAKFEVTRGVPSLSTWNDAVDLNTSPGDPVTYTVPTGTDLLEVKYTAGFLWMNPHGDPAGAPVAETLDGSASEPVGWGQIFAVSGGQVLSFQNDSACWVIPIPRKN